MVHTDQRVLLLLQLGLGDPLVDPADSNISIPGARRNEKRGRKARKRERKLEDYEGEDNDSGRGRRSWWRLGQAAGKKKEEDTHLREKTERKRRSSGIDEARESREEGSGKSDRHTQRERE